MEQEELKSPQNNHNEDIMIYFTAIEVEQGHYDLEKEFLLLLKTNMFKA